MSPDLILAIRLQDLDQRIADLQKEISALPKHIVHIETALDQHTRRLEADRAALAANQNDRRKMEGDIQLQEQKVSKLRDQMLGAKTNEQYKAFQSEIEYCQKEIRAAEDRILDLMSESEPLERNVKAAEAALNRERAHVAAEKKAAEERTAAHRGTVERLQSERGQITSSMAKTLYADYERIRLKWRGSTAVADATEGRCGACQIVLRPQLYQELRTRDDVVMCESCGRILYYNPPVAVDEDMGPRPGPAASV